MEFLLAIAGIILYHVFTVSLITNGLGLSVALSLNFATESFFVVLGMVDLV